MSEVQHLRIIELEEEVAELTRALEESIKLQSHYAVLLNDHDGGKRRSFASASEWVQRIKESALAMAAAGGALEGNRAYLASKKKRRK